MKSLKQFGQLFFRAGVNTIDHDGIEHAGYLAFLGILAFFPFLVFFVSLAGFLGELEATEHFIALMQQSLPQDVLKALEPRINEIISGPPQGLLTLAILGTIWTASSALEGTRTALNRAYRVATPPAYIWRRLLSIGQFLLLTVIVFTSMMFLVFVPILWSKVEITTGLHNLVDPNLTYLRYSLSVFALFLGVALSYYFLANIKQNWRTVSPGAILVIIGWLIAAKGFMIYLDNFNQLNLVYGSLGGIIVALLFIYIMSIIYIFGAEFNYLLAKANGWHFATKDSKAETEQREES